MGAVTNERLALAWHLADVAICTAVLGWAVYGVIGHFWLRRRRV